MEKQKLSGKTILKLVGALLALAYLGFCLYAGITGKFPNMHKAEHVMRFGDLKNWVSGGISAVMIFALCITSALNDLNLQKGRKKSFLPFFLTMILPIILLLLLESYLDIGWIGIALYAGIAVFLFGVAWTPQLLNQWIARRLLRDEPMSGKQQEELKSSLPGLKPENIFVTKLDPEKIITDGEDKTATNMNDQTLWTRLWLIEENEDSVAAVVFDLETFSMESYTKVK